MARTTETATDVVAVTEPKPALPEEFVVYTGTGGSERVITRLTFEANGCPEQRTARWHNFNAYRVPAKFFTAEALELVLAQPGLDLVEEASDGTTV